MVCGSARCRLRRSHEEVTSVEQTENAATAGLSSQNVCV